MAVCDTEVWASIPGSRGYQVSSHGRIRSLDRVVATRNGQTRAYRGRVLSPTFNQAGHPKMYIRLADGTLSMRYVHVEVALAFIGPRPAGRQVAHRDGIEANCHFRNLRYATPTENAADKRLHGTNLEGDRHHASILRADQIPTIRDRLAAGHRQREIAVDYGVSRNTISSISTGVSWRCVPKVNGRSA